MSDQFLGVSQRMDNICDGEVLTQSEANRLRKLLPRMGFPGAKYLAPEYDESPHSHGENRPVQNSGRQQPWMCTGRLWNGKEYSMEDEKNLKEIPERNLEGVSGGAETFEPGEKAIVDGSTHVFIMGYLGDSMYCVLMPSGNLEQVHASRISRP